MTTEIENHYIENAPEEVIVEIKKKMGRPRNPARWLREDGKYNTAVINEEGKLNKEYYANYWKTHYLKPSICENCGTIIKSLDYKKKHIKTKKCLEFKARLEELENKQ